MARLRPTTHRQLDFVTVAAFALAPFVLSLSGPAAWLAWALAAVHLLMTLVTEFPGRPPRPVPLRLHGAVELVVGIVLLVLPLVVGWSGAARWFYMAAGVVILIVRTTSTYDVARAGGDTA
jgi:hypothetical protein